MTDATVMLQKRLTANDGPEPCQSGLSSCKVSLSVYLVTDILRTGSGKIIRFKLRETRVAPINKAS